MKQDLNLRATKASVLKTDLLTRLEYPCSIFKIQSILYRPSICKKCYNFFLVFAVRRQHSECYKYFILLFSELDTFSTSK